MEPNGSPEKRLRMAEKRQKESQGRKKSRFRGATWESNLIVGAVLCAAGLSGKVNLVGTQSSIALLAVGAGLLVWGGLQWMQRRR